MDFLVLQPAKDPDFLTSHVDFSTTHDGVPTTMPMASTIASKPTHGVDE